MKKILSLIIVGFVLFGCFGKVTKESIKTDLEKNKILGKVKSITEFIYLVVENSGDIQKGDMKRKTNYKFDERGNKIETARYYPNGRLRWKWVSKYDQNGNKIELSSSIGWKWTYKYDDEGNLIESAFDNSNKSSNYTYTYKYDGQIYEIKEVRSRFTGAKDWEATLKFDNSGNSTEETFTDYDSDGSLYIKYTSNYNQKGNRKEKIENNSDGSSDWKINSKYEYDSMGNWIRKINFKIKNEIEQAEEIIERKIEYYD
tara:strand:- start:699 stop:1472 length:774 start_codon:yes stop_codon:yes gene_type:complete